MSWIALEMMQLDEAADFGWWRVDFAVSDARRNLAGVCGRWYPVVLELHRFFFIRYSACSG